MQLARTTQYIERLTHFSWKRV